MSVLAMFKLKFESLLQFDKSRETNEGNNLKKIFGVKKFPSDTQMRAVIDEVSHLDLMPVFKKIFSQVQRQKAHKQFSYEIPKQGNYFLLNIDGTGFFASSKIKCPHCLTRSLTKKEVELLESEEILKFIASIISF